MPRVISAMNVQMPVLTQLFKTLSQGVMTALLSVILASCGGDDYQEDFDRDYTLSGGGVDGPLTFTNVAMYALLDTSGTSVVYSSATPGTAVATGTTNQFAQIENLVLNDGINPPYILEFTSTNTTRDLTTGDVPVLGTVRTLVTEAMLEAGDPVYGTPLTTMALDIALNIADASDGVITRAEFDSALVTATSQVKSTLGLGMDADFDIFTVAPVLDSTVASNDTATLQKVALYRSAIEATRVLIQQVGALVEASGDTVLSTLASDLADGVIDGQVSGALADIYASEAEKNEAIALLEQSIETLCIAEDAEGACLQTVADINTLLVEERVDIGVDSSASVQIDAPDLDAPRLNTDSDGDSVNNDQDAFPDNAQESVDTDADGIGNNSDNCPAASNSEQTDTDNDGAGDACDDATAPNTDADGDGVNDSVDNCPSLANVDQLNTDSDTQGNVCDSDDDGDGVSDTQETTQGSNPLLSDTDGDGDLDGADNCVLAANADQLNSDSDSQGNVCDTDDDNDGTPDTSDDFPLNAGETTDTDDDGVGNNGDNCPTTANANQLNTDGAADGGNACDLDDDNDGVADVTDNCSLIDNASQANLDEDTQGNACDTDDDNDGLTDAEEVALGTAFDDADTDDDGHNDGDDNCPLLGNDDQGDADDDGVGDVCDNDSDNDGLTDEEEGVLGTDPLLADTDDDTVDDGDDNCPLAANTDQLNTDNSADGGNECDDNDDNDSAPDSEDALPLDPDETIDTDGDGVGDNGDNCPVDANPDQADADNDALSTTIENRGGNVCDIDDDNDGLTDEVELVLGSDPTRADTDGDSVRDNSDNCPSVTNQDQLNTDFVAEEGAGIPHEGDVCDLDDDGDSYEDAVDLCPLVESFQGDIDGDEIGDECDDDADGDGIANASDPTPFGE